MLLSGLAITYTYRGLLEICACHPSSLDGFGRHGKNVARLDESSFIVMFYIAYIVGAFWGHSIHFCREILHFLFIV